jgi:hypothetical protein
MRAGRGCDYGGFEVDVVELFDFFQQGASACHILGPRFNNCYYLEFGQSL